DPRSRRGPRGLPSQRPRVHRPAGPPRRRRGRARGPPAGAALEGAGRRRAPGPADPARARRLVRRGRRGHGRRGARRGAHPRLRRHRGQRPGQRLHGRAPPRAPRHHRPAGTLGRRARERRGDRGHRRHRARRGLRRRGHLRPCTAHRGGLGARRPQDVHHQRGPGRRPGGRREDRPRGRAPGHHDVRRPRGDAGPVDGPAAGEDGLALVGHPRGRARRRHPRRGRGARRRGPRLPPDHGRVPAGARRARRDGGRPRRRGAGHGHRVRPRPRGRRRAADRPPGDPPPPRRHGGRARGRAGDDLQGRRPPRPRPPRGRPVGGRGQVLRGEGRGVDRRRGGAALRGCGLPRGDADRAPPPRRAHPAHRRGHRRDPARDPREAAGAV
ncbi:MAG: Butyryl-CoA dehydrogenase, partial [uncultured Actinomycetospora sp.]